MGVLGTEVFGAAVADFKVGFEALEELFGRESVEVAHHTVVIENGELLGGEANGQVVVIFLAAGVCGIGLGAVGANARGGGGTVVAVGNVEGIHLAKLAGDGLDIGFAVDEPEGVAETVDICHEVVEWLFLGDALDEGKKGGIVPIGQEGRADVGVGGGEMTDAVVFFVAAGEFVFLDAAGIIVFYVGGEGDAVLRVAVHGLGIEIVALALVLCDPAFGDETFELATRFGIDAGIVLVGAFGEVDFRTNDVIERAFVVAGLSTRFGSVEHIVGTRGDEMGDAGGGTKPAERFY